MYALSDEPRTQPCICLFLLSFFRCSFSGWQGFLRRWTSLGVSERAGKLECFRLTRTGGSIKERERVRRPVDWSQSGGTPSPTDSLCLLPNDRSANNASRPGCWAAAPPDILYFSLSVFFFARSTTAPGTSASLGWRNLRRVV